MTRDESIRREHTRTAPAGHPPRERDWRERGMSGGGDLAHVVLSVAGPAEPLWRGWGTATVRFRAQPRVLHIFVLTLGFSRRSYYRRCPNETLPQFLEAHEHAFAYFGGHTREHLYDRPRTVCQGTAGAARIACRSAAGR